MITQARLKELLSYDPAAGEFRWLKFTNGRVPVGSVAGSPSVDGYSQIKVDRKLYLAHRLAWLYMTGAWPKQEVDHTNGIRNDNTWANLREASHAQNAWNTRRSCANSSGYKGVRLHYSGKWEARIAQRHYGLFDTPEQAFEARCKAIAKVHGEFARSA